MQIAFDQMLFHRGGEISTSSTLVFTCAAIENMRDISVTVSVSSEYKVVWLFECLWSGGSSNEVLKMAFSSAVKSIVIVS